MPVRGTQSFIQVLSECWRRPSLLALELLWRWLFGVPLLAILAWQGMRISAEVSTRLAGSGLNQFSLLDPDRAVVIGSDVYATVAPPLLRLFVWLAPLAVVAWSIVCAIGRNAVLRRYDPSLP